MLSNALDEIVFFVVTPYLLFVLLFGNAMDTSAMLLLPSSFEAVDECISHRKETSSNSCAISHEI